jgi:hypothetical protein
MADSLVAVFWWGATLLLIWSAWRWSQRLFPNESVTQTIIHTTVLCWAVIVVTSVVLGTVGFLLWYVLLGTVAGLSGVAMGCLWLRKCCVGQEPTTAFNNHISQDICNPIDGLQPLTNYNFFNTADARFRAGRMEPCFLMVWVILLGFAVAHVLIKGLLVFPTDWDSLMYHIPLIDQWLAVKSLYAPNDARWYNPGNNELLGLWLVAPFSGDFLISLNNLPVIVLLGAAAIELASGFGLIRPLAHFVGLSIVLTTPALRQLTDAENDLAVVGLFLASLLYAIRYGQSGHSSNLVLAALSIGLLAGVKYYALGYSAVAAAAVIVLIRPIRSFRNRGYAIVVVCVGITLCGSYWYIRNYIITEAPLYPKGFTASSDLWREMRPGSWSSTLLGNGKPEVWALAINCVAQMAGPCHVVALAGLPFILSWLTFAGSGLVRLPVLQEGRPRVTLALLIVASLLVLVVTPNTVEMVPGTMDMLKTQYLPVRFGLSLLSLSVIGFGFVLQDLSQLSMTWIASYWLSKRVFSSTYSAALCHWFEHWGRLTLICGAYGGLSAVLLFQFAALIWDSAALEDQLLITCTLALFPVLLRMCYNTGLLWRRTLCSVLLGVSVLVMAYAVGWLSVNWHEKFARFYDARYHTGVFTFISKADTSTTELCACDYRYFPYLGSRREMRVSRPLWIPTYERFTAYLRKHQTTLVVFKYNDMVMQHRYENVPHWLAANPKLFAVIYKDNVAIVVRVNQTVLVEDGGIER